MSHEPKKPHHSPAPSAHSIPAASGTSAAHGTAVIPGAPTDHSTAVVHSVPPVQSTPADPPLKMVSVPVRMAVDLLEAFYDADQASNGQFMEAVAQALKDEYVSSRQADLTKKQAAKATSAASATPATFAADVAPAPSAGQTVTALDFTAHTASVHAVLEPEEQQMLDSLHTRLTSLVRDTGCIKKKNPCPCKPPLTC